MNKIIDLFDYPEFVFKWLQGRINALLDGRISPEDAFIKDLPGANIEDVEVDVDIDYDC